MEPDGVPQWGPLQAKRLVEGLGGSGFRVVKTLRGKTMAGPMMFAKGTAARIGDELAALHVNVEDSDAEDPPVNVSAAGREGRAVGRGPS